MAHQHCWRLNRWRRGILVQADLRRSQGEIVCHVNQGRSPGLCLQGRAGWYSSAHPALATPRIMPDPAPTSLLISFAPQPRPPFSWSSSRPAGLFVPTFSKQKCDASHQNISFSPKISPELSGEAWISCAPRHSGTTMSS